MQIAAMFTELAVTVPAAFAWLASHWQSFAPSAASLLIMSIWQSAVLVCALEIAAQFMPRASAAHRFALWSAGFVLSLAVPLFSVIHLDSEGSSQAIASASGIATRAPHVLLQVDARWASLIAVLWLAAALIRAASLGAHSVRLRRLWETALPVGVNKSISASLSNIRAGRVLVCTTRILDRPSVIGFFAPRILIPAWLLSRLTPGEFEQIVIHEAEHLRRRDDWTNLLQKICLVVFPLNPALAWIEHHLCKEREMACDEGVLRVTNAPRAYAACLASLAERGLERRAEALSLGAWRGRSELFHRVRSILLHKQTMSRTAAGALLSTLGAVLVAGSLEMSRVPDLVAFVPKHNMQATVPARQVRIDALLASENNQAKLTLPPGFRAVPAKAVLPSTRLSTSAHVRKAIAAKPADKQINRAVQSAQQIAKADQTGDRVISAEPPPTQWVVVAAWEEISTMSQAPRTISDFEPQNETENGSASTSNTAVNTTSIPTTKTPAQSRTDRNHSSDAAHHFTVTQLILRVVPANPNSSSALLAPSAARDGWFVIQL